MIELILNSLQKVSPRGSGKWIACCPAHDDKSPSLAITQVSDGRILLKCFAGCGASDIVQVLGFTLADLFPEGGFKQYKGFQRLEQEMQDTKEEKFFKEKAFLLICDEWRKQGKRLTPETLEKERQAYLKVRSCKQ